MKSATFAPDSACVDDVRVAVNVEPRRAGRPPDILLMHYTGFLTAEKAIDWLAISESRVSCHYVVDVDGRITQLVPEELRAWHAGDSVWHGETDINSLSVGIEIQNPGHERGYSDFPPAQMQAVMTLSKDIIARHAIPPERVLAHSDIAPHRKIDPGEKFSWQELATHGIGHWVPPAPIIKDAIEPNGGLTGKALAQVQDQLRAYGYGLEVTGEMDVRTRQVVKAFQRHFRPGRVDGIVDASTAQTATRLLNALPARRRAVV